MTNQHEALQEYDALLTLKERDLLLQRDEVWRFVDTQHKAKSTKEFQQRVRVSSLELSNILVSLIDFQKESEFKDAAKSLCTKCRELETYTKDMNKILGEDLTERQKEEDKKKVDLVKNVTFYFGLPIGFFTVVKNGLAHDQINPTHAAEAGFTISNVVVFNGGLGRGFKNLGQALCKTPQQIRNSFTLFYMRETFKEKAVDGVNGLKVGTDVIGREAKRTSNFAKETLKKIMGGFGL